MEHWNLQIRILCRYLTLILLIKKNGVNYKTISIIEDLEDPEMDIHLQQNFGSSYSIEKQSLSRVS